MKKNKMKDVLKFFEYAFVFGLIAIILLTTFFVVDAYIISPKMKGISLTDLKHILFYLVLPLTGLILLLKTINNKIEKYRKKKH